MIRDVLIHGFDAEEGLLYAAGYLKNHHFGTTTIKVEDFVAAYEAVGDSISWATYNYLYKRRTDIHYHFDPVYVKEMIGDYLQARSTADRLRGISNPIAYYYYYGVEAVQHYRDTLTQVKPGDRLGQSASYTLWEHKRLMHQRMEWMIDQELVPNLPALTALKDAYETVVHKAATARLSLMKYTISNNTDAIAKAVQEIDAMIPLEHELLQELAELIP